MAAKQDQRSSPRAEVQVLERGDIYFFYRFFYRPRGDTEVARSAADVRRLYLILHRRGNCVIIYMCPTSFLTVVSEGVARAIRALSDWLRSFGTAGPENGSLDRSRSQVPPLYFHPHDYEWLRRALPAHWKTDIRVWRSIDLAFSSTLVADNFVGGALLRIVYRLEQLFPHALARLGRYPAIVIRKDDSGAGDVPRISRPREVTFATRQKS